VPARSIGRARRADAVVRRPLKLDVSCHENYPPRRSMSSRTASCSCGQLRIQVEGEPRGVGVCHCLACQQRTGSVFAALASFSAPYKSLGTATEYVRVGAQGARFTFRFCPICGTTVFHTEDDHDGSVSVAVGAFADPWLSRAATLHLREPQASVGSVAAGHADVRQRSHVITNAVLAARERNAK
jgi:hypothetical protein